PSRIRHKQVPGAGLAIAQQSLQQPLASLLPLRITEVSSRSGTPRRPLFEALLHQHHYLSYHSPVGENLQYLVCDVQERPVACVLFGASAWQCASRDQYLGWEAATR